MWKKERHCRSIVVAALTHTRPPILYLGKKYLLRRLVGLHQFLWEIASYPKCCGPGKFHMDWFGHTINSYDPVRHDFCTASLRITKPSRKVSMPQKMKIQLSDCLLDYLHLSITRHLEILFCVIYTQARMQKWKERRSRDGNWSCSYLSNQYIRHFPTKGSRKHILKNCGKALYVSEDRRSVWEFSKPAHIHSAFLGSWVSVSTCDLLTRKM